MDLEADGGLSSLGPSPHPDPQLPGITSARKEKGIPHESIDSTKTTISTIRVRYSAHLGRRPSLRSRMFDPHRDTAGILPSRPTGQDFPKNADVCRTGNLSASD